MTDLLDTIHDLQREVKALKAIGDTSGAVATSIYTRYQTFGGKLEGTDIKTGVKWTRIPDTSTVTEGVRTAGNTAILVEISGQGYTRSLGNINTNIAIMWAFKHGDTVIYNGEFLGEDGNVSLTNSATTGTTGAGWYSYNTGNQTHVMKFGPGVVGPMYCMRYISDLQPHTDYTIEAFPAYGLGDPSGEIHNYYDLFVQSVQIKATNVL
jgi:hypothetical protein